MAYRIANNDNILKINDLSPLYLSTQKDIIKLLQERMYQVRDKDKKKSKKKNAKGGHVMWYRIGVLEDGTEVPQGILLSSSSDSIAWRKQLADIGRNDTNIVAVKIN